MKNHLPFKLYTRILSLSLVLMSLFTLSSSAQSTLCSSKANNQYYEWVTRIKINDGTRTSGKTGYADFTSSAISTLNAGQTYNVEIDVRTNGTVYNEYVKLWLDLNQDNIIQDPQELIFAKNSSFATFKTFTGTVTIPNTAFNGSMIGRMIMQYAASPALCGTYTYGTTYDVKVNILGGVANPVNNTLTVSTTGSGTGSVTSIPEGINTANGVNSFDFKENTNVTLIANPTSGSTFLNWSGAVSSTNTNVVVNLNTDKNIIANFNYEVPPPIANITTAGSTTVCSPDTVLLTAGTASSYQWFLNNNVISGATSNTYNASESGSYTVVVKNSVGVAATSTAKIITVNELPETIITADNSLTICPTSSVNLTASEGNSYLWNNGETTRTINVNTTGNFSVTVTNNEGCSFTSDNTTVVVQDNISPEITAPANISVFATSSSGAIVNYTTPFGTDNCDVTTELTAGLTNGATFPIGTTTISYTATDTSGNSTTASFNVEVVGIAPEIVVPTNFSVDNDSGICGAIVNYTATETTGIPASSLTYDIQPGSLFNIGSTTVTATATNVIGTSTKTFVVNVNDNESPNVIAKNITVELDENGNASITPDMVNDGSSDNCEIVSYSLDVSNFSCENLGENTVNLIATDASGNSNATSGSNIPEGLVGAWEFDGVNPLVDLTGNWGDLELLGNTSINNGTLDLNANGFARTSGYTGQSIGSKTLISYVALENLNVRSGSAMTIDGVSNDNFDAIVYAERQTRRWMSGSSYFRRTQDLNPGYAESQVNEMIQMAVTYHNTGSNVLISVYRNGLLIGTYNSGSASSWSPGNMEILFGARHSIGNNQIGGLDARVSKALLYNRALSADEIAALNNNAVTGTPAIVTVVDNRAPEFLTTESAFILLDENGVATYDTNGFNRDTVYDNCGIERLEFDKTVFNCDEIGFHTINVTAYDASGNSTIGQINLEVREEISPTVITKDIEVILDENGNASITPEDINNGTYDNCSFTLSLDVTDFSCANVGNNIVNLTATDNHGLPTTAQATVRVIDNTNPTVATNNITIELDADGNASITTDDINNGSSDACGIASYALNNYNFYCEDVGTNTVTLTVTDVNQNSASLDAIVTVKDVTAPNVITQDVIVELDANGSASITTVMIDNGSSDACGIKSIELDNTSFSCDNVGVNTVTLSVTDNNNNVSTATASVTVNDVTAPTVITQTATITLANGEAIITPSDVDGGTFDNCSFTLSLDNDRFTCNDIGENTVVLTATDASGNTTSQSALVNVVGDIPTIDINDFNAVQTQKKNTIFLGFGPQSVNLSTVVSGGSGFTYEWTSNTGEVISNEANPSISPTVSTTYDVTVTNSNGCTASTSVYICVIDARAFDKKGKYKGKVVVCHHTNGKKGTKHVEISISASAVMTHLTKHGTGTDHADKLGACNATCVENTSQKSTTKQEISIKSIEDNLSIYPNPSNGIFDIKLTAVSLKTDLYLFDTTGKLIEQQTISKENSSENIITMGNYKLASGFYLLKIITKNESITKKLIVKK